LNLKFEPRTEGRGVGDDVVQRGVSRILTELAKDRITYTDRRVLVTGGAGFLGSWICDALVQQGAHVTCVDNFSSSSTENIEHLGEHKNFKLVNHDITQPIFFDEKFDIVMHLASRAEPLEFEKYPIQILKANTLGIWVALGIAKKDKAAFLYTSTSEIYGSPPPESIPTPETFNGNVNPVGVRGCYEEAKRCGEAYVVAYQREHNLDTRIVRIFNTYGPRMRAGDVYGRAVSRFIDQAIKDQPITIFGDGKQTRSFLYATDQVEGLLRAATLPPASHEVINIGADKETTILELAETIKGLAGSRSPIVHTHLPQDDPPRRCPNIEKAKSILGWSPKVNLEEGLRDTILWAKNQKQQTPTR
jgi:UDP-glucuronate decarboxylase